MNISSHLAKFLASRGVERVFGLPGTETIEPIEALRQQGIDFVLTHHESTAAFAAAMTGHLTGTPGVCMVAGGPGITNATSGIIAAHLDRMPLCVVIGDHVDRPGLPTHQRLPLEHVAAGIVRDRLSVDPATIQRDLPRVFGAAAGPLPGPVVVSISTEAAMAPAPDVAPTPLGPGGGPSTPGGEPDLLSLTSRIDGAQRVFIIIGAKATFTAIGDRLVRLAELLGSPVADTPQSKGWFPNDHPLYLGTIATRRNQPIVDLANSADIVLAIGLDSVELLAPLSLDPPVLALSPVQPSEAAIPALEAIETPLVPALDVLLGRLVPKSSAWSAAELRSCVRVVREGLWPDGGVSPQVGMWPQSVVDVLGLELPDEGIVTTDVGSHKLLMVQQWIARRPNSFLCSTGLASMGTGIPFAMAAKLQAPATPVAAVIGDGGFLMYAGECATLRRLPGPFVVVVMNDGALSSIKVKQERRGYPPTGTVIHGGVDVSGIARGFGLAAVSVANQSALVSALEEAVSSPHPMVIDCRIDPRGYEWSQ